MQVLLAALHPPGGVLRHGGVQSWISTVARRLFLEGCSVSIWGPDLPLPEHRFDLGVFAHGPRTIAAAPLCKRLALVSHGIIDEERPDGPGIKIFTSEEVRDFWKGVGPVLRQPIDLEFWTPDYSRPRNTLVFYSYRANRVFSLDRLARRLGLEFVWLKNVEAQAAHSCLQGAAVVCASGRAALEAMACDAPTMICDWRDYNGGPLVCPNMDKAREHNYSGRGGVSPVDIDMEQLARETMKLQRPREYVIAHHNARRITMELLRQCSLA